MNRRELRARSWVHWAGLCVALCAILAVWGLWPAEPPWLIIASLSGAFLALLVVESRYRRDHPPPVVEAASVEDFLAAVDARYGTGGAASGAAVPGRVALWNGEQLPPMLPPVMATAPYPDHDHGGPGPCPACARTLGLLARLGGAQAEAGERLAAPGLAEYAGRLMADTDAQARAYMADLAAQDEAAREDLADDMTGPSCGVEFAQHLCAKRGRHGRHRCECGTVWGQI